MVCPDCGVRTEVVKTMVLDAVTERLRECPCGTRFTTVERVARRLPSRCGQVARATGKHQATAPQPPGNGSEQYSGSDSDPLSGLGPPGNPDQTQAHVEPEDPVIFAGLTLSGGDPWDLRASVEAPWVRAFPAMDRQAQYAKAAAWLAANPTKRKTARGMPKFLFGWLERAQNSGRAAAAGQTSFARPARAAGNVEVLQGWLAKGQVAT